MDTSQVLNSRDRDSSPREFEEIIGNSPVLERVFEQVRRVAPTNSTVLIEGETGTGKELIAHAVHNASSRRGRPFVKLNCAAIPLDLLESELFGHERGAFTGAIAQKIGRFELANKGTLFLDEVGDIPPALQPKFLRVLQEQEFKRLAAIGLIKWTFGWSQQQIVIWRRWQSKASFAATSATVWMCFRSSCHRCVRAARTFQRITRQRDGS